MFTQGEVYCDGNWFQGASRETDEIANGDLSGTYSWAVSLCEFACMGEPANAVCSRHIQTCLFEGEYTNVRDGMEQPLPRQNLMV